MRRRFVSIALSMLVLTIAGCQRAANPIAPERGFGPGSQAASLEAKSGGSITLYPVTAELRCPLTMGCTGMDGISGDSIGPYRGTTPDGGATTQEGTSSNHGSYFTESGLFLFVLKKGFGRQVSFDFSRPSGTAPCAAKGTCRKNFSYVTTDESLPGSRTYPVSASGADLPNGFMGIPVGGSSRARFFINFPDPAGRALLWTVRFDPGLSPGSSLLTVTRPSENTWTVEAGMSDVGQLGSAATSGKSVKVNEGNYSLPFKMTISR